VDASHRREIEALWGLPEGAIAPRPGYDATAMFEALDRGALRAIWIIGTNPAATLPDLARVRRALTRAELVIVQDAYHPTETNAYAHVLLPAAVNVEQEGTFTNGERRVSLLRKAVEPPGDAAPDWWWLREIALGLGITELSSLSSASAIFADFARSTRGQANDQSGIDHARLAAEGPLAWPCPSGGAPRPLHEGGRFATASGRARFWARPHLGAGEQPDACYPLLLTTGRIASHWHTRTKTGIVTRLVAAEPSPYLQMHPDDAAQLGLRDGQAVAIESRRGHARSVLRVSADTLPGLCFMPMHWNALWADGAWA
jgi:ferredoxin-nitrate reductase